MKWMGGLSLDDVMALPSEYRTDIIQMINDENEAYERSRS